MARLMLTDLLIFSLFFLHLEQSVTAVNECMSGHKIDCFECNSWSDPRCKDPFNYTLTIEDMPPIKKCEGCCVKLVQNIGGPAHSVRRTCTDSLDINLWLVDHVCMSEGGGAGHMCFCEENDCNAANMNSLVSVLVLQSVICSLF